MVDFNAVFSDNSGILHAMNALDDGRSGQPDAPSHLDKLNARIFLEFGQDVPSDGVEKLCNF
jgi:hypothetical protein